VAAVAVAASRRIRYRRGAPPSAVIPRNFGRYATLTYVPANFISHLGIVAGNDGSLGSRSSSRRPLRA
jgi:hypothetical protein